MKIYKDIFNNIISLESLFSAWETFKKDKRNKKDVMQFEWSLEKNIFQLHHDLKNKEYRHGLYASFYISDPKRRHINKATVRDRVLHHAVFTVLNPIFEPTFIPYSFSCRVDKGTHKGVDTLNRMARSVSSNNHKPCFALKCDIKKFFASVDHQVLLGIISRRVKDDDALWLLKEVVSSFTSEYSTIF